MKNTMLALLVFCFLVSSCDEVSTTDTNSSNSTTTTVNAQVGQPEKPATTNPPAANAVPPQELEKVGQVVAFTTFNSKVKQAASEAWAKSPFQVALQFTGDQMDARKKVISAESLSGGEVFNKLLVTIEDEGLMDDSIKGSMMILRMELQGEIWIITKATRVWKCWPKRGHVAYNAEPCS